MLVPSYQAVSSQAQAGAHRLHAIVSRGSAGGTEKHFPMRLFHLTIAYLTLLLAVVAVAALLPSGRW